MALHAEEKLEVAGYRKVGIHDFAGGPLTLESAQSPWPGPEWEDMEGLQELGFVPKKLLQPTWTEADIVQFKAGLADWASQRTLMPSPKMDFFYYLSHHVMDRRFSQQACQRMLNLLEKQVRAELEGPFAGPAIRQPPAQQGDSESERGSDCEGDSDSADEADFHAGTTWQCDLEDF